MYDNVDVNKWRFKAVVFVNNNLKLRRIEVFLSKFKIIYNIVFYVYYYWCPQNL